MDNDLINILNIIYYASKTNNYRLLLVIGLVDHRYYLLIISIYLQYNVQYYKGHIVQYRNLQNIMWIIGLIRNYYYFNALLHNNMLTYTSYWSNSILDYFSL